MTYSVEILIGSEPFGFDGLSLAEATQLNSDFENRVDVVFEATKNGKISSFPVLLIEKISFTPSLP